MRARPAGLVCLFTSLLLGGGARAAERQEVSLNGTWQYVKVKELQFPPPAEGWQEMDVPGQLSGYNYERAWFRRSFAAPTAPGQRVKVHFGGVKWNSEVYVNGKKVGGNFGGCEPFDVDVTDALKPGAGNELLVGTHDWTGVFVDRKTSLDKVTGEVREAPQNEIISPIGGLTGSYGIWDDVKLVAEPALHVADVFIKPSVAQKTLTVEVTVTNESAKAVTATVTAEVEKSEEADKLPALGAKPVDLPPGESRTVTLTGGWAAPHLWSHLDPHLYFLKTTVTGGGESDVLRTRFGFREFTVKGPDFYLNGKKIHLLSTSWWPSTTPMSPDEIRKQMLIIRGANCTSFRTHTQPWCERYYSVADEVGLMMIPEGAVWNDDSAYRLDDQRFWDNYALQLRKMVQRDRNKPSVIMWSLENEFYGGRLAENTPFEEKLAGMGRIVKQADPTRPIFYESDGDPGGVADVIGLHYPHEYPDYRQWPNEADWLDKPSPYSWGFLHNNGQFLWKRNKPLYIGEFLWIPSSDPSWDTVWFGDESYRDYALHHGLGKAEAWREQIIGYRRHEVSGISPWTMIEGGPLDDTNPLVLVHRYAYQPIAAFPREYDSRFFGGETVARTLDVFNDSFADQAVVVKWGAEVGGKRVPGGEKALTMPSGAHEIVAASFAFPAVTERSDGQYVVTVEAGGKVAFSDSHPISVFPRLGAAPAVGVGLYDPAGTTGKLLERATPVKDLAALPKDLAVLVVGAGALGGQKAARPVIGQPETGGAALGTWVAGGGRAIVLEQTAYPEDLVPVALTPQGSTMTFAQMPNHPLLRGVRPEDLKWWRGDHTVTAAEPTRPARGACEAVVVSGSAQGISEAPLMVVPFGDGAYVLCQMKVVSKAGAEPTAGVLLRNLLEYAAQYPVNRKQTALYCDLPAVKQKLAALGVLCEDVTTRAGDLDLSPYNLLIYASSSAEGLIKLRGRLEPWVEAGGQVLLHGLAPEEYAKVADLLDPALKLAPYDGPVLRSVGDDPLLFSFANEDLYWLGKHEGIGWSTTPLATNTARAAFEKTLAGKQPASYSAKDLKLAGPYVSVVEDGVIFASAGTGTMTADFPKGGEYVFGLVARSTPCEGVYAMAAIRVDGKEVGTVATRSNTWETYTTYGDVAQGKHEVQVAFINDANKPPEDRNLYVQTLLIAPSEKSGRSSLLTSPGALARFPRGKGAYVLDEINWEAEQANGRKAARFICGVLTALGARFRSETGTTLPAASMDPQPGMPWFSKEGGAAHFGASGYVETEVEIARAGRYRAEIVAGGTPAQNEYAIVEVLIDGQKLGQVQLTTGNPSSYFLDLDLPAGVHKLRLAYPNDLYLPPNEDRNLVLEKIIFYGG